MILPNISFFPNSSFSDNSINPLNYGIKDEILDSAFNTFSQNSPVDYKYGCRTDDKIKWDMQYISVFFEEALFKATFLRQKYAKIYLLIWPSSKN